MRFFINIIGKVNSTGGNTPLEKLNSPTLTNIVDTANELSFDIVSDNRATSNLLQYSLNEDFTESTTIQNVGNSFTLMAEDFGSPIQNLYIRIRSLANGFISSDYLVTQTEENLQTPIIISNFQGIAEDGQNELSWDSVSNNTNILLYRNGTLYQTLAANATSYIDTSVTNGVTYSYYVIATPVNFNFIGQATSTISLTPESGVQPQLSTPLNLQTSFTQVNGEVNVTWNNVTNANQYRILLDGVFNQNVATNSVSFTGLTVAQQYQVQVIAQDTTAVFLDSEAASTAFTVADVENEDFLTLEQFGGESFYIPLDGRLSEGIQHPLITTTPYNALSINEQNDINTLYNLQGTNYTKITTDADVFTNTDVGLEFVCLWNHLNIGEVNYSRVDEFPPSEISARYSNVVYFINARNIIVDFEYNGGNIDNPTTKQNVSAYLFKDNSQAWQQALISLNQANTSNTLSFGTHYTHDTRPYKLNGVYVIKNHSMFSFNTANDLLITSNHSTNKVFLKFGAEDRYNAEITNSSTIYTNDSHLFQVSNLNGNFRSLNVTFGNTHSKAKNPGAKTLSLFIGFLSNKNITHTVIAHNARLEDEEIQAGISPDKDKTLFTSGLGNAARGGIYTDIGTLSERAIDFADLVLVNCKFAGVEAAGAMISTGHGQRVWWVDTELDFENQTKYSKPTSEYESIISSDINAYSIYHPEIQRARNEGWMPTDVMIIRNGNIFNSLAMGGSNRANLLNIDRFVFFLYHENLRYRDLTSYWRIYFRKNKGVDFNLPTIVGQAPTTSSTRAILGSEIPRTNKRYTISRYYDAANRSGVGDNYSVYDGYQSRLFSLFVDNINGSFINGEMIQIINHGESHKLIWLRDGNHMHMIDSNNNLANNRPSFTGTVVGVDSGATAEITQYFRLRREIAMPNSVQNFCIRNITSWGVVQQKHPFDMNIDDKLMIPESGVPVELQPGDEFYIEPFIVTKNFAEASLSLVGSTITQLNTNATATIIEISKTCDLTQPFVTQQWNTYGTNYADFEDAYLLTLDNVNGEFNSIDGIQIQNVSNNIEIITAYEHDLNTFWSVYSKNVFPFGLNTGDAPYSEHDLPIEDRLQGFSGYNIYGMYCVLSETLPVNLPLTFPIKIKLSNSEYLLNNNTYRPTTQKYIANGRLTNCAGGQHFTPTLPCKNWTIFDEYQSKNFDPALGGNTAGHLAYSQGHNGYYFKRCAIKGFWRQNYAKPQQTSITFNGVSLNVLALKWYSNGHTLVDCTQVMSGQFSNGEESAQNFVRRRFLEDYLISEGLLPAINTEAERAKLRSLGGVPYNANGKYDNTPEAFVRAETINPIPNQDDSDPGLPLKVINALNNIPNFSYTDV